MLTRILLGASALLAVSQASALAKVDYVNRTDRTPALAIPLSVDDTTVPPGSTFARQTIKDSNDSMSVDGKTFTVTDMHSSCLSQGWNVIGWKMQLSVDGQALGTICAIYDAGSTSVVSRLTVSTSEQAGKQYTVTFENGGIDYYPSARLVTPVRYTW